MGLALLVIAALLLVLVVCVWCVWTASRLDRLHLKIEAARASLGESLQRRSSVAIELASTGVSDPASVVLLMAAAVEARDHAGSLVGDEAADVDWQAQSALTRTAALVTQEQDAPHSAQRRAAGDMLADQLRAAARQASIARRIHNDLVARTIELRSRRRVRWFGLAGRAPQPTMVEFDDTTA